MQFDFFLFSIIYLHPFLFCVFLSFILYNFCYTFSINNPHLIFAFHVLILYIICQLHVYHSFSYVRTSFYAKMTVFQSFYWFKMLCHFFVCILYTCTKCYEIYFLFVYYALVFQQEKRDIQAMSPFSRIILFVHPFLFYFRYISQILILVLSLFFLFLLFLLQFLILYYNLSVSLFCLFLVIFERIFNDTS